MRLLRAEIRKLNRPLIWGAALASAAFCVLLAWGGGANAAAGIASPRYRSTAPPPTCSDLRLPDGEACNRAAVAAQQAADQADPSVQRQIAVNRAHDLELARGVTRTLNPVAVGQVAAGLLASLPGAMLVALLAAGLIGGEWGGRTMKSVLSQNGHRWQLAGTKLIIVWLAAVAIMFTSWAALALAGPVIVRLEGLPSAPTSTLDAARLAASQLGRALLVIGFFASVGAAAGFVIRNTVGTLAATVSVVLVSLILAGQQSLGSWSPATWVQSWMGFKTPDYLPTNFWSRFLPSTGTGMSQEAALIALGATIVTVTGAAIVRFARTDVLA